MDPERAPLLSEAVEGRYQDGSDGPPGYTTLLVSTRIKNPKRALKWGRVIRRCFSFIVLLLALYSLHRSWEWNSQQSHREAVRRSWDRDRAAFDEVKAGMEHQLTLWIEEERRHTEAEAAERAAWELERVRWREESEARQQQWKLEEDERKTRWAAEDRSRHQTEEVERARLDQLRQSLSWTDFHGESRCLRYGVREYMATLGNVPRDLDPISECQAKTVWINGRDIVPHHCESLEAEGKCHDTVRARWIVDFEEVNCKPVWRKIEDHGCQGNGIRVSFSL